MIYYPPQADNSTLAVEVGLRAQRDQLQDQVGQRDRDLDLAAQREADLQVRFSKFNSATKSSTYCLLLLIKISS